MNIFRLLGDLSHLLAIIILLLKIWKTRSCAGKLHRLGVRRSTGTLCMYFPTKTSSIWFSFSGISGKSQILFSVVYTARYLDLLTNYISAYNTFMKMVFIMASYATVYLMYVKFKATYDHNHDTFRIEFLLIPTLVMALLINHEFTVMEVSMFFIMSYDVHLSTHVCCGLEIVLYKFKRLFNQMVVQLKSWYL